MRLFKRGGVWYAQGYGLDGRRWQRSTRAHDRRAAEQIARAWELAAAAPGGLPAAEATVRTALELLLERRHEEAVAGRKSHETVAFYAAKGGHVLRVLGEHTRLRDLSARHVDAYVSTRRGEGAAESTISKELVTLRAALKLARRADLFHGSPEALLPVGFAPAYKPRTRFLSPAELVLLLGELVGDRAARVAFMVATSACWGESERAQRVDVGPDAVFLRGTKRQSRERVVPLVTAAQLELVAFALEHAAGDSRGRPASPGAIDGVGAQAATGLEPVAARLFRPWTSARGDLHRACARAGIPPCSPNDLRRTTATWMRQGGVSPDVVGVLMGHADGRMVERVYGRVTTEALRSRIASALALPDCSDSAADSAVLPALPALPAPKKGRNIVPRDGIEPPTRGFSVPTLGPVKVRTALQIRTAVPTLQRRCS